MHVFGRCATVAWIRKDVQPAVPFKLHIRAELRATDKILWPANNSLKGSLEPPRNENADGELSPRGQGPRELERGKVHIDLGFCAEDYSSFRTREIRNKSRRVHFTCRIQNRRSCMYSRYSHRAGHLPDCNRREGSVHGYRRIGRGLDNQVTARSGHATDPGPFRETVAPKRTRETSCRRSRAWPSLFPSP